MIMSNEGKVTVSKKRLIFGIAGVIVLVLFNWVLPVPEVFANGAISVEAEPRACFGTLGILLFTVIWWMGEVFPTYVTAMVEVCLLVMFKYTTMSVAFTAFTGTTEWMIFGGLALSVACEKTGILRRIAYFLMKIFPPTYKGQILALIVIGTIIQPMIPTTAPKCILGVMLAMSIADAMEFEPLSTGRAGLFAAAWLSFGLTAPAFITSSHTIADGNALLPEPTSVLGWTINALPWLIVMLVAGFVCITLLYPNKGGVKLTKEFANERYKALGKMSRAELFNLLCLLYAMVGWFTSWANASVIGMSTVALLFMLGVLDKKKDLAKIDWKLLIFVMGILAMSSVFSKVGLKEAMTDLLGPVFAMIPNRIVLFALFMVVVVAVRFVLVSQSVCMTFFTLALIPVFQSLNMAPFIAAFTVMAIQQVFICDYQMTAYVPLIGVTNGGVEHKSMVKFAFGYLAMSVIGIALCCMYWGIRGMM